MRLRCRFGIHDWLWGAIEIISMISVEYATGIRTPFSKTIQKGKCQSCGISTQRDISEVWEMKNKKPSQKKQNLKKRKSEYYTIEKKEFYQLNFLHEAI